MARSQLLIACPETNADILYAGGFRAPDAFAFLETDGKKFLLLNDLEIDRGRAARQDQAAGEQGEAGDEGGYRAQAHGGILHPPHRGCAHQGPIRGVCRSSARVQLARWACARCGPMRWCG